ncbi:hypothetical protein BDN70DRAFT_901530 [Pholiota conissans]|uniref:Uncharacterized protein n=1 Tax=Pholiota conissans TaxID=109636 RepID=A0A9P5YJY2_9AGAR|nr:hypothetical protein BDN70DRAFT_901530 [Pholiota conissans]
MSMREQVTREVGMVVSHNMCGRNGRGGEGREGKRKGRGEDGSGKQEGNQKGGPARHPRSRRIWERPVFTGPEHRIRWEIHRNASLNQNVYVKTDQLPVDVMLEDLLLHATYYWIDTFLVPALTLLLSLVDSQFALSKSILPPDPHPLLAVLSPTPARCKEKEFSLRDCEEGRIQIGRRSRSPSLTRSLPPIPSKWFRIRGEETD